MLNLYDFYRAVHLSSPEEAVYLADRIIILTERPSVVSVILPVDLPREILPILPIPPVSEFVNR